MQNTGDTVVHNRHEIMFFFTYTHSKTVMNLRLQPQVKQLAWEKGKMKSVHLILTQFALLSVNINVNKCWFQYCKIRILKQKKWAAILQQSPAQRN